MIDKSQYPRFFSILRETCILLGKTTQVEQDEYYRATCLRVARVLSVKQIKSQADFDAVLAAFRADGGNYRNAVDLALENQKREAYVVRVMTAQIMQLKMLDETNARAYFDGILFQSRLASSFVAKSNGFYLDIPAPNLHKVLQILDTHLRRLKRELQVGGRASYSDKVKYRVLPTGVVSVEPVEKYYYSNQNFTVNYTSNCS